jgi:dolichol kinase
MHSFIKIVLYLIPIALVLGFFLKGKKAREWVVYIFQISKKKVGKILNEFRRKTFHLIGILIPGIYYFGLKYGFLSREYTLIILGGLTVLILIVEFLRYNFEFFRNFLQSSIGNIMREHEHKKFFGSTWYLIGFIFII